MQARVVWSGRGMRFEGRAQDKPWVAIHIPEKSEEPQGSTPMELLFLGALACTASDVADILRKGRSKLEAITVDGEAERATKDPRVFTRIHITYRIRGTVQEKAARRAVMLSQERYCSATITLRRAGAEIRSDVHIEPPRG